MRKSIILLFLFFSALTLFAENASNVRVRQEGKSIVITYDLNQKSVVRLLMASGESDVYAELKAVSGNVGKGVPAGENRKIVWKPLEENEKFIAQNVRFKVEAQSAYEYYTQNAKIKTLVMGQLGYSVAPQLSYGVMIGQMYKGIGWFANVRTDFQSRYPTDLYTGSRWTYAWQNRLDETPFFSGKSHKSHFDVNVGFMMNFLEWSTKNKFNTFGCYIGAGFGNRTLQWETTDGTWINIANGSTERGVSANIGIFGSISGATISAGVSTINFAYMEVEMGIGFMF